MTQERKGDSRLQSETSSPPVATSFAFSEVLSLIQLAETHHEKGRDGCALAILKVLGGRSSILPKGFAELRASVHARIGIS